MNQAIRGPAKASQPTDTKEEMGPARCARVAAVRSSLPVSGLGVVVFMTSILALAGGRQKVAGGNTGEGSGCVGGDRAGPGRGRGAGRGCLPADGIPCGYPGGRNAHRRPGPEPGGPPWGESADPAVPAGG